MRAFRLAIHPSTFMRRLQIRVLREEKGALHVSPDNPNDIMCARTDPEALALLGVLCGNAIEGSKKKKKKVTPSNDNRLFTRT